MLTLGLAGVALGTSACSLASPKVIATPYAASDGTNADLPLAGGGGTVQFRNFFLVSEAKGKPGILVGAVTTDSVTAVPVQIGVLDRDGTSVLAQATLNVQPGQLTQVGPGGTAVQVPDVKVPPGSVLTVSIRSASGSKDFSLPVLAPVDQYSSITPGPASATSSPDGASPSADSASPSPSAS
jgi:hypothetical protein